MQTTIFDMLYPKYKIDKPIRLIEMFAGYGSQTLALKYLGVKFEHWKICEWAVKSIQAYKDIHFNTCYADTDYNYAHGILKEDLVDYLFNKGISSNYNEPMTKQQIERLSEEQLKTIYNNIAITHNLVNIQQVKGKDLKIVDTDKYEYILTYSFPCQDLSLAGKGKGMSDTSTRSGAYAAGMILVKNATQTSDLRIRKLTPKECFRLMGVKDEDYEKCAKNQSNASLYHLAGDSICTTVLMAIFSQLLNIEWRNKLWNIKNCM